jgi:ATP-dependent Clp protease adaptor protein ClpS
MMSLPIGPVIHVLQPRLADDGRKGTGDGAPGTAVITKTTPQTQRPNLYRVLLLNDDYTPMDFVVHVLECFFNKDHETAHRIMLHVHQHGVGECGRPCVGVVPLLLARKLFKRERDEALEQQRATSEVLRIISSSPGELKPAFNSMLRKRGAYLWG